MPASLARNATQSPIDAWSEACDDDEDFKHYLFLLPNLPACLQCDCAYVRPRGHHRYTGGLCPSCYSGRIEDGDDPIDITGLRYERDDF